jgi:hypothetical protein
MANPFTELNGAAQAVAATVTGIEWTERYDGQEPEDIASRVARAGSGVHVRVASGRRDVAGSGVQSNVLVHFIIGCRSVRSRASAAEAAEELLWDFMDNMENNRLSLSWLMMGLQYREFEVVYQLPTVVVMSVVMETRFDLAEWTE